MTAIALVFAVFLTNPAPICVLDEVDALTIPTSTVSALLQRIVKETGTRFLIILTRMTMARMDRLFDDHGEARW